MCLSELSTRCRNFLHVYFGQAEYPLMEESQNLRQLSELSTLGRNFLHIYFGLAERLLSEETTSDGGRNFRH